MSLLKTHLRIALADLLAVAPEEVSLTTDLGAQGVDSLIALRLARKIADATGYDIDLEWLFDHPTLEQLAAFLEAQGATVSQAGAARAATRAGAGETA